MTGGLQNFANAVAIQSRNERIHCAVIESKTVDTSPIAIADYMEIQ